MSAFMNTNVIAGLVAKRDISTLEDSKLQVFQWTKTEIRIVTDTPYSYISGGVASIGARLAELLGTPKPCEADWLKLKSFVLAQSVASRTQPKQMEESMYSQGVFIKVAQYAPIVQVSHGDDVVVLPSTISSASVKPPLAIVKGPEREPIVPEITFVQKDGSSETFTDPLPMPSAVLPTRPGHANLEVLIVSSLAIDQGKWIYPCPTNRYVTEKFVWLFHPRSQVLGLDKWLTIVRQWLETTDPVKRAIEKKSTLKGREFYSVVAQLLATVSKTVYLSLHNQLYEDHFKGLFDYHLSHAKKIGMSSEQIGAVMKSAFSTAQFEGSSYTMWINPLPARFNLKRYTGADSDLVSLSQFAKDALMAGRAFRGSDENGPSVFSSGLHSTGCPSRLMRRMRRCVKIVVSVAYSFWLRPANWDAAGPIAVENRRIVVEGPVDMYQVVMDAVTKFVPENKVYYVVPPNQRGSSKIHVLATREIKDTDWVINLNGMELPSSKTHDGYLVEWAKVLDGSHHGEKTIQFTKIAGDLSKTKFSTHVIRRVDSAHAFDGLLAHAKLVLFRRLDREYSFIDAKEWPALSTVEWFKESIMDNNKKNSVVGGMRQFADEWDNLLEGKTPGFSVLESGEVSWETMIPEIDVTALMENSDSGSSSEDEDEFEDVDGDASGEDISASVSDEDEGPAILPVPKEEVKEEALKKKKKKKASVADDDTAGTSSVVLGTITF